MHFWPRRWLHKCHRLSDLSLRFSIRKDAKDPFNIPIEYVSDDLAIEYASFWTNIREESGDRLEEI